MDTRLEERLLRWHEQLDILKQAEEQALTLDAAEKPYFSELMLKMEGKTMREREVRAYASEDWKKFQEGLVAAKSRYNHERRLLELKMKAYESEYLTFKVEAEAIRRAG